MKQMQLIKESKVWYKLWSIRFALMSAIFAAAELTMPLFNGVIPDQIFATISMLLAVASAASRVIKQTTVKSPHEEPATTNPSE